MTGAGSSSCCGDGYVDIGNSRNKVEGGSRNSSRSKGGNGGTDDIDDCGSSSSGDITGRNSNSRENGGKASNDVVPGASNSVCRESKSL